MKLKNLIRIRPWSILGIPLSIISLAHSVLAIVYDLNEAFLLSRQEENQDLILNAIIISGIFALFAWALYAVDLVNNKTDVVVETKSKGDRFLPVFVYSGFFVGLLFNGTLIWDAYHIVIVVLMIIDLVFEYKKQ